MKQALAAVGLGLSSLACAAGVFSDGTANRSTVEVASTPGKGGATLLGAVVNHLSSVALANALVIVECSCLQGTRETQTDDNGRYVFRELPPGEYTVLFLIGSGEASKVISIGEGDRVIAHARMDPGVPQTALLGTSSKRAPH